MTAPDLLLDLTGYPGPMHQRLVAALRDAISTGRLTRDSALPSSRLLAEQLGCSRWVVTQAYEQLTAEGYLDARPGSATRVRAGDHRTRDRRAVPDHSVPGPVRYDLAPGLPDLRAFPRHLWAEATRAATVSAEVTELGPGPTDGLARTRTALAAYLGRVRDAAADQVVATRGATAAMGSLAAALLRSGQRSIAFEDPSWPGLRVAAERQGLQAVPIPVDEQGLRVDLLCEHPDLRSVVATPAHQFPTGVPLAPRRRAELIDWAEQREGLVVEDDYDAEFRYDRKPVAALQRMAPDHVVLLGSVSKTLSPALGLGWMIAPPIWRQRVLDVDPTPPGVFDQLALATMIERGWYDRHIRHLRRTYRRRRERLLQALEAELPECRAHGLPAGLHVLLELPPGRPAAEVVAGAAVRDVRLVDAARYRLRSADSDTPALVLGYGNLRDGTERDACRALAAALLDAEPR